MNAHTETEHRMGCIAWQAWDIPFACTCPGPEKVRRCDLCGHRVAQTAQSCWWCDRHPEWVKGAKEAYRDVD